MVRRSEFRLGWEELFDPDPELVDFKDSLIRTASLKGKNHWPHSVPLQRTLVSTPC